MWPFQKTKNFRRPRWGEKVKGVLGYFGEERGMPAMEFMDELAPPAGLHKFRKMRMQDPIVGGLIIQIENIMRRLSWTVDGENSDFVENVLNALPGGISNLNYELSSAFCYGFYIGEKIWKMQEGKLVLIDVSPRFQPSIEKINDEKGRVKQVTPQGTFYMPYGKCVHHMFLAESREPFGLSLLRHLYKPYYYKMSTEASEAVGMDRDLSGLPVLTAPEGFNFSETDPDSPDYNAETAATLDWALDIVSSIRKDNLNGIVKPHGWKLDIVRGENRASVPTTEVISRYNTEMAAGMLENFLSLGAFATTNNANTEVNVKNFLRACDTYASVIAQTYNSQIIGPLCEANDMTPPSLKFAPVNIEKLSDLASFFGRLVNQGVITPTTTLEKELLQMTDFTYDTNKANIKPSPEK